MIPPAFSILDLADDLFMDKQEHRISDTTLHRRPVRKWQSHTLVAAALVLPSIVAVRLRCDPLAPHWDLATCSAENRAILPIGTSS